MSASRKSASSKALTGTLRQDRQPRIDYSARLRELPEPPDDLPEGARIYWARIGAAAIGIGTLTGADLPLLQLLSVTLMTEAEARLAISREGMSVAAATGGLKKHPASSVAETARGQAVAMFRELGLSPRSRQSVDVAPAGRSTGFARNGRRPLEDDADPARFDEFLQ